MGVFEGRRAMLIDGVILEQEPMNPPHAITLGLVEEAIQTAFGSGWWLRHQSPLVLGQDTDPEPDLAFPGRPRNYTGHPTTAELVVEVADPPSTSTPTTSGCSTPGLASGNTGSWT